MHTQFHDKVDDCKTLGYTKNSYKHEKFEETDLKQLLQAKNICLISVGFITVTSSMNV